MPPPRQNIKLANVFAFTLAEVLITLGIIGVVAALTIPTLVEQYRKQVLETRLKHFYSTINQSITRAEADFGDRKDWFEEASGDGKLTWMQKYFFPYMKIIKYEDGYNAGILGGHVPVYYLPHGGAFSSVNGGAVNRDWVFWPGDPHKCPTIGHNENLGVCAFWFFYSPDSSGYYAGKGIEPWKTEPWRADINEKMKENCKNSQYHYDCTALIQANGWKIPKDYPRKIKY